MGKDPAFLFYPGDYLRDTQCISEKTQVAYDRIMCEHMRNISLTQKRLNFFTKRLSEDEVEELMSVLTKVRGGYQIEWVALSIENRRAYSESRRRNRTKKPDEDVKNICEHMENANENANESKKETKKVSESKKPTLPDLQNYFKEKGSTDSEAEKFFDYYSSNGWKVGRNSMKDWKATARNWIRRNGETKKKKHFNIDKDKDYGSEVVRSL